MLPGNISLPPGVAHNWTPHSGRSFLPTSTAYLGVEKSSRDFLGGWNAQIINMQISVLNAVKDPAAVDPIAESESLREFADFLQSTPVTDKARAALV